MPTASRSCWTQHRASKVKVGLKFLLNPSISHIQRERREGNGSKLEAAQMISNVVQTKDPKFKSSIQQEINDVVAALHQLQLTCGDPNYYGSTWSEYPPEAYPCVVRGAIVKF